MSFSSLLKVHEHLDELFLLHQEALLQLDLALARERLLAYRRELQAHMQVEEELLLPVYERAGRIAGGPPEFFLGEHRRMLEFLDRFQTALDGMKTEREPLTRRVIRLLDDEAAYKSLCDHHDQRERSIFFPTLDRVTSETERNELIAQCLAANLAST